jgi:hypothetical protein
MKIEEIFTLSSYENRAPGIAQIVDGNPPKEPSLLESLAPLTQMIRKFGHLPTGTKIKVTMESVE